MAKKQTRRSISVSRTTYERLKAFCESNNISMSQLVETRVNDFLGPSEMVSGVSAAGGASTAMPIAGIAPRPLPPRPMTSGMPARPLEARPASQVASAGNGAAPAQHPHPAHSAAHPAAHPATHPVPMTSAAARYAVEPPPPIIKPRQETAAPKPAEKRPEQIFTF